MSFCLIPLGLDSCTPVWHYCRFWVHGIPHCCNNAWSREWRQLSRWHGSQKQQLLHSNYSDYLRDFFKKSSRMHCYTEHEWRLLKGLCLEAITLLQIDTFKGMAIQQTGIILPLLVTNSTSAGWLLASSFRSAALKLNHCCFKSLLLIPSAWAMVQSPCFGEGSRKDILSSTGDINLYNYHAVVSWCLVVYLVMHR